MGYSSLGKVIVTYVRGHFRNIHGTLEFDPAHLQASSVEVIIDARTRWTGEPERDAHLRSRDFLDVENHPRITFRSRGVELCSLSQLDGTGVRCPHAVAHRDGERLDSVDVAADVEGHGRREEASESLRCCALVPHAERTLHGTSWSPCREGDRWARLQQLGDKLPHDVCRNPKFAVSERPALIENWFGLVQGRKIRPLEELSDGNLIAPDERSSHRFMPVGRIVVRIIFELLPT